MPEKHRVGIKRKFLFLALFLFSWTLAAAALAGPTQPRLEPEEKAKTLLKAMSYHRSARFVRAKKFILAVIEDPSADPNFFRTAYAALEAQKDMKIGGKPMKIIKIRYADQTQLKRALIDADATAVYIPEGSRSIGRSIVAATRELKMLSIGGQPDYVHWLGTSLGVESRAGKPKLMINLSGCKLEGIEFDPRLLRLASVFF